MSTSPASWTAAPRRCRRTSPDGTGSPQRAVLDRGDERLAVGGPGDRGGVIRSGGASGSDGPRRSARSRTAPPPRSRRTARIRRRDHGVPAHVRQHRRVQPLHQARPLAAALGAHAVLDALGEQDLHAHADAEHRPPASEPPVDHPVAADRPQPCHARRERAHTRHHQAVGGQRGVASAVTATPLRRGQGSFCRTKVSGTVVQHDDAGAAPSQNAFRAGHARRARIGRRRGPQRPGHRLELGFDQVMRVAAGHRRCRQMPAVAVRDSKKCRVSVVS